MAQLLASIQGRFIMKSGLGVRSELFASIEHSKPELGFLEAHSENYFGESIARSKLLNFRQDYAISLHGVGLSLGRADDLNQAHLRELKQLVDELDPLFVSEHLSWSAYSHRHVPDLLPLPLTDSALTTMCEHVDQMQVSLGRQIFVENPSNYLLFDELQIPEPEFLNELAARTGCGLLLDVNNVHVSATNVGRDAKDYLTALKSDFIGQYHLAGYTEVERDVAGITETLLIDTHNHPVYDPVWALFEFVLERHGARPTLLEWDSDFPEFSVLLEECAKADKYLTNSCSGELKTVPLTANQSAQMQDLADDQDRFLDSLFTLEQALQTVKPDHQHRVWVYQNNVFAAIQDYLKEVYPATRGVVGADFFKQMAQRYIQSDPPGDGNIYLYGAEFHRVIATFEGLQSLPYLADVIRYEWALHTAYFAKVSDSLDPNSVPQEQLLTRSVRLNDSANLISSEFPVYEIHRQSLPDFEGEVSIDLGLSQDKLLVYKIQHQVHTKKLNADQAEFVGGLLRSENLLQLIDELQGSISAEALSQSLAMVFDCRLLAKE